MTDITSADQEASLWQYIPLEKFRTPPEPMSEVARSGLRAFWKRLRPTRQTSPSVDVQAELRSIPNDLLDSVAPIPDWGEPRNALLSALQMYFEAGQEELRGRLIVGAPGSGTNQILTGLAHERSAFLIEPPTLVEILKGGDDWLSRLTDEDRPLFVLPCLERCYLRHHNGLILLRKLLEWLTSSRRRCLIGCNSWAWAYFKETLDIDSMFPATLVLDAFDEIRLQRWFRALAADTGGHSIGFRQADDGSYVLPPVQGANEGIVHGKATVKDEEVKVSDFLRRLAGRSRGIPLVAWAIWQSGMHVAMDDEMETEAQKAAVGEEGETIWVRPWTQLDLPTMPAPVEQKDLFLLHTLLLHDGLPPDILPGLLPFPESEIMRRLHRLSARGLLKEEEGLWRVTLLSYPAVRHCLNSEGYLVDPI